MKSLKTFTATIYVGLKDTDKDNESKERDESYNSLYDINDLKDVCQKYCDKVGFCVSFTPTKFIYTNGNEPGVIVGIIQYPRFPKPESEIKEKCIELAKLLMKQANQYKVSIVFTDETVMLEREDLFEKETTIPNALVIDDGDNYMKIADEMQSWCIHNNMVPNPHNIVFALWMNKRLKNPYKSE